MGNIQSVDGVLAKAVVGIVNFAVEFIVDGTPVIGHLKGFYHYIKSENEHGDKCMSAATRATVVLGAGMLTGGLGAGACCGGLSGVVSGYAYDLLISAKNNEPTWTEKARTKAFEDPNNPKYAELAFELSASIAQDFAMGCTGCLIGNSLAQWRTIGRVEHPIAVNNTTGNITDTSSIMIPKTPSLSAASCPI